MTLVALIHTPAVVERIQRRRQQLLECAAVSGEDDAGADEGEAAAEGGDRMRLGFPRHREVAEKATPRRERLVDDPVAGRAVESGARPLDKHAGSRRRRANGRDEASRREHTAFAQQRLAPAGPAAIRDARTGEVDDRVGAVDLLRPDAGTGRSVRLPRHDTRARASGHMPASGQDDNGVLAPDKVLGQRAAEEARAASEDDLHREILVNEAMGRPWRAKSSSPITTAKLSFSITASVRSRG